MSRRYNLRQIVLAMSLLLSACGTDLFGKKISDTFKNTQACVPNTVSVAAAAETLKSEALLSEARYQNTSKVRFQGQSINIDFQTNQLLDLTLDPQKAVDNLLEEFNGRFGC